MICQGAPRFAAVALAAQLALAGVAEAALYTDASQLPKSVYDFVVVGAGTAGNVIASRLTEDPAVSVLVIEAGGSGEGVLGVEVPWIAPSNLPNSSVTWNYTTAPQAGLNNRVLGYSKGRVLGGSSSINFLAYSRGADEEYDRWAALTGDSGWSWKNLIPYYMRNARLVPSSDGHNTTGQINPAVHGTGPVEISLPGYMTEIDSRVLNTSKIPGSEFTFNLDMNSGRALGFGLTQSAIGQGQRSSSATAYLEPALSRDSLDVLIHTTVTRLIPIKSSKSRPSFRTVEFAASSKSQRYTVTAKKEVILSAGSIATPQIMMLSGIGPKKAIESVGLKQLVNLPDVGQNLMDHPILTNYWTVASNNTYDDVLRNSTLLDVKLEEWQQTKKGLFSASPVNSIGFTRLPSNSTIFRHNKDPSAGPHTPHLELLFSDGYGATVDPQPPTGNYLTVWVAVVSPSSTGHLTLASADPFAYPIIDPNFLSTAFDRYAIVQAIKSARQFVQAAPWQGFVLDRYGRVGVATTDDEILAAARNAVVTIWHPSCTARMSPENASWGVLTPDLRVKGTVGLRVVDASAFPKIPAEHPMAAVYILAERAADLIKSSWSS